MPIEATLEVLVTLLHDLFEVNWLLHFRGTLRHLVVSSAHIEEGFTSQLVSVIDELPNLKVPSPPPPPHSKELTASCMRNTASERPAVNQAEWTCQANLRYCPRQMHTST